MNDYNFYADLLNKYSQLTPWVQALIALGAGGVMLGIAYFIKETVVGLVRPLQRVHRPAEAQDAKPEWRDKYYRDKAK
jgi:hypothetical protein